MAAEQSEEAVAAAMRGMFASARDEAEAPAEPEVAAADTAEVEVPVEVEADPAAEATAETTDGDDVASLRQRLAERDADVKRYEEQLVAVSSRNRQSLETLNRQRMQYASQRDRARQLLEKAMSPDGVDKSEAERLLADIRSGYNANSANYEPAPPTAQPTPQSDENSIAINEWLNDNGLTEAEAASFDNWIRTKAQLTERERRLTDSYTLLTSIAPRWRQEASAAAKADDNTRAVKVVARVQKQAAKAAAGAIGSATKSVGPSPASKSPRLSDDQLSGLIKEMWENR